MKHIITLDGKYLTDWKEREKDNGYVFAYDLEFTTDKNLAKPVEFRTVISLLTAIRNSVTPKGVDKDGTVTYSITTDIKPTVKESKLDTITTMDDLQRKVIVDLDWLNSFVNKKGIKPTDLALAFGFDGKRIYYGTKLLIGAVSIRYINLLQFAQKYPEIHGHWYLAKKTGGR